MKPDMFERKILAWYAAHASHTTVSAQCERAQVRSRISDSAGMFCHLDIPRDLAPCPDGLIFPGPVILGPDLPHGASVDLWATSGKLDFIEVTALSNGTLQEPYDRYEIRDE